MQMYFECAFNEPNLEEKRNLFKLKTVNSLTQLDGVTIVNTYILKYSNFAVKKLTPFFLNNPKATRALNLRTIYPNKHFFQ